MDKTVTISVSLSRKVNLGNYESADVFMSINGLNAGTTEAEIDALLEGPGAIAYRKCADALKAEVGKVKSK